MFKRIAALTCLLVLVVLTTSGLVTRAQTYPQVIVGSPILTLHSAPDHLSDGVAVLQSGDKLTPDGRTDDSKWLHVKTESNQAGWVLVVYLIIPNNLVIADLPVSNAGGGGGNGGGNGDTKPTATPRPTNPAPVHGRVGGRFELGGQVQGLSDGTVNAMRTAGMKWVKQQVHVGDGASGVINQAHALGFKILLSVVGDRNSLTDSGYQSSFASSVGTMATNGADAIEVGNEMNIDREWPTGQIDPTKYVTLLAKAYNAIKSAHPSTIVISGALAPTGAEGAFGLDRVWNDDHYYSGMARAGAASYMDCVGVHYNEGIISPYKSSGDPRGNYPTRYFYAMLRRATRPFGRPACFTELGYLTPEGYGALPGNFGWAQNTTVADQASWLAQAAVLASNSGRVRLMIVFNVDFTGYGADPQAGYAMIRPGGGCPACDALHRVTH